MPVYFDNNASMPLLEGVLDSMLPYYQALQGNASSLHQAGRLLRQAVDDARAQVASFLNVPPAWVIFTSGGTEANNLAVKGMAMTMPEKGMVAISTIEHEAVVQPVASLVRSGWAVKYCPVDADGVMDMQPAKGANLISVMMANNETGIMQDMIALRALVGEKALIHTDAVQAIGRVPVDMQALGVDCLSVSAHKFGGPKGIGALIVNPNRVCLAPLIEGGGQEFGLRSGTENVPAIVGFGRACEILSQSMPMRLKQLESLKETLLQGLQRIEGCTVIGQGKITLPNTILCAVEGLSGEMLLMELDKRGICVSGGAACGSAKDMSSPVLKAMNIDDDTAAGAIRISLSAENTLLEVTEFFKQLGEIIHKWRPSLAR